MNATEEESSESSELIFEGARLEEILTALVHEVVRARIRNRTILDLLVERGLFTLDEYKDRYKSGEEHDFAHILELILLRSDLFRQRNTDWIANEQKKYGFDRSVVHGFELQQTPLPAELVMPVQVAHDQKRKKSPKKSASKPSKARG